MCLQNFDILFIRVSFWGRSCLICHVLWKLFHGSRNVADLRSVPMTVFICTATTQPKRLTQESCGDGLEEQGLTAVHRSMEQKEIAHQIWITSKIKGVKGDRFLSSGTSWAWQVSTHYVVWWPRHPGVFWLAIRHVACSSERLSWVQSHLVFVSN